MTTSVACASVSATHDDRDRGLLDLLAWALAQGTQPLAWWAERLGLDGEQLDALLEGEGARLLRARMRRAVAETSGAPEVSQALRGCVIEIAAGQPEAGTLAQLSLALRRLPDWIAAEWTRGQSLSLPAQLRDVPHSQQSDAELLAYAASIDPVEYRALLAETRELLEQMEQ
jgi:hypothetical protein